MDTETATELLVGLAIVVGVIGVVVPVLPGALLVWVSILVWSLQAQATSAWIVLGVATVLLGAAQAVKYLVPHRRLRSAGLPQSSLLVGGVLGVVGFFVIPVVGLVIGFVAGVYAAEHRRLRSRRTAWTSTTSAVRAVGLAIVIELTAAVLAAGAWLAVAVST